MSVAQLQDRAGRLSRRLQQLAGWWILRPLNLRYARWHRARLRGVSFVGVTGSAGKTTAKAMITEVLTAGGTVRRYGGTGNRLHNVGQAVTSVRPSDDFCVMEVGAESPGFMDPMLDLLQPAIGVVTTVGNDHVKAFGSQEGIAAEKSKLVAALPPDGTAVLNADDPLVWAMRERCDGEVVSYGLKEGADLQARDISAAWPERLSLTVRYRGEDHRVQTQFCGGHWVPSVLAAMATGVAAGVPLADAAAAISQVAPPRARMEPLTTPEGITFIRDDWKASLWAMPSVLNFLKEARAARKILVLGTLSDYSGPARPKYTNIGREALAVADQVIFVGSMATLGLRARKYVGKDQTLLAFPEIKAAAAYLQETLRAGDLVVLKGSGPADHLSRLYHVRTGPVACWRMNCGKNALCDGCVMLRPGPGAPEAMQPGRPPKTAAEPKAEREAVTPPLAVLVGIGNPGEAFRNTPHNVGFEVLDLLAERHGLSWEEREEAEIAHWPRAAGEILLVKPKLKVNHTGKAVAALAPLLGFTGGDCILVHDDIHLPIGKLRVRQKGSDGGHLGVRSMLSAFQTGEIPRVKIGVRSEANTLAPKDYLVAPFPSAEAGVVAETCAQAADRLTKLVDEVATRGAQETAAKLEEKTRSPALAQAR
ncbi:MAG: hypothetical protein Tsb0032_01620 [Kiloniellaceae bacterium]